MSAHTSSSTPHSQTLSAYILKKNVTDQVTHPHETTGKIVVLYI